MEFQFRVNLSFWKKISAFGGRKFYGLCADAFNVVIRQLVL